MYGDLNVDALRRCAQQLVGRHNFVRLSANRGDLSESARREDPEVTTRSIYRVAVEETPELLTFEIEGSGFLYKMVRLITGSLVHMARGRDSEDWFRDLLHNPAGEKSNQRALPDGLYLVRELLSRQRFTLLPNETVHHPRPHSCGPSRPCLLHQSLPAVLSPADRPL